MVDPRSNSVRTAGSRYCARDCRRSRCTAKSSAIDELILMQQILQDRFDERLNLPVRIADPGHVGLSIKRRRERTAGWRRHDHARFRCNQIRTQIVRMTTMPGCDSPLDCEALHQRPQISHETVLPNRETIELTARRSVLIFKNA